MSGVALDGGRAERAIGVPSATGLDVACGNNVEDEEQDATDAAEQRWKMYDSLHCGSADLAKQILGQTHMVLEKCLQTEQAVESTVGAARSEYFGTDTDEEKWSSGKPLA